MKHTISIMLTAAVLLVVLTGLVLSSAEKNTAVSAPGKAESSDLPANSFVGPWRLADDMDLEALSETFPGAAEFGSGMEIFSDGRISWYIGADGASGTCVIDGDALTADVTGELDGAVYRIELRQPEPKKLTMIFKDTGLVWVYGEGDSLRGED